MIIPKEIMELPEKERNKVFRKIKAIMKKRGVDVLPPGVKAKKVIVKNK